MYNYCPTCGKSVSEDMGFCPYCGMSFKTKVDNEKKELTTEPSSKPKKSTFLGILCVILLILCVCLYNKSLENADKVWFLDTVVVCVEDDGSDLYHKYGCKRFLQESYWVYNKEAAVGKGYKPCDLCCYE